MYSRQMNGKTLDFGCSGFLWKNVVLFYDRQTESLWPQISGSSIYGRLKGKSLPALPVATVMTWKECARLFPNAKVLVEPEDSSPGMDRFYEEYDRSGKAGIFDDNHRSPRLPPKSRVIGIRLSTECKAYPVARFRKSSFLEDRVAGRNLILFWDERSQSGSVFETDLEGRKVSFVSSMVSDAIGRDRLTHSAWNLRTGECVSGDLKGKRLPPVHHLDCFWYAWSNFWPQTKVYVPTRRSG